MQALVQSKLRKSLLDSLNLPKIISHQCHRSIYKRILIQLP
jgi:hypothetical protein